MQFRAERRLIQAVFAETSACTNTRMSKHNYFTRICGLSTKQTPFGVSIFGMQAGGKFKPVNYFVECNFRRNVNTKGKAHPRAIVAFSIVADKHIEVTFGSAKLYRFSLSLA